MLSVRQQNMPRRVVKPGSSCCFVNDTATGCQMRCINTTFWQPAASLRLWLINQRRIFKIGCLCIMPSLQGKNSTASLGDKHMGRVWWNQYAISSCGCCYSVIVGKVVVVEVVVVVGGGSSINPHSSCCCVNAGHLIHVRGGLTIHFRTLCSLQCH